MHDAETELRRLLDEADKPLKQIADEAGVGYHRLHRWFTRRTVTLGLGDAELLYRSLSGKEFVKP